MVADSSAPAGWTDTPPPKAEAPKGLDAIHAYFKDSGHFLNPHAADALAATSFAETAGDTYAVNKSSKAAGAFQWLGPRKQAFLDSGDTSPEGMAKFAMSELPKYKRSWAALNDPSVSADDLKKTLIDEFEAPGGSAAQGYGEAAGDLSRARAYKPPGPHDVKVSPLPSVKAGGPQGWSDAPPTKAAKSGPEGWSDEPPGRQDPSIVANTPKPKSGLAGMGEGLEAEADANAQMTSPGPTWADMAKDRKNPMWARIGAAIGAEGKNMAKGAWSAFTVFGDVASGKAKVEDPETQDRIRDAALQFGMKGAPGELVDKIKTGEAPAAAKAAEVAPAAKPKIPTSGEGTITIDGKDTHYKNGHVWNDGKWEPADGAEAKPRTVLDHMEELLKNDPKPQLKTTTDAQVIPKKPPPAAPKAQPVEFKSKGQTAVDTFYKNLETAHNPNKLDMAPEARVARAKEQGYNTDLTLYHGTGADFLKPNVPKGSEPAVFLTDDPKIANSYVTKGGGAANIIPVWAKMENPKTVDFHGQTYSSQKMADALKSAKAEGHDSVILKNIVDIGKEGKTQTQYAFFEPGNLRAKYGAAFDPTVPKAQAHMLSAAQTPIHEIAAHNIAEFEKNNPDPTIKQHLIAASDYAKGFYDTSGKAKAIIQKNEGNMNQMGAQAKAAMTQFGQFTRGLNPEEQLGMIQWLQKPGEKLAKGLELSPEAQGFADTFKGWMQKYRQKIESLDKTDQMSFREDFVTQLWRNPKDAMTAINEYGAKKGSGYFMKARVFDDYEAGIRAGKAPLTTDPMELFARYIENASKKISSVENKNEAKEAGLLVYRKPEHAPEGWVSLKGEKDSFGHDAYAPPGFATIYNNHYSTPAEVKVPGTNFDVLSALQTAANKTTGVVLTLSGFHPALVSMESIASGVANGITKLKNGRPIAGIAEIAKAPLKPLTGFRAGYQAQKRYITKEYGDETMQRVMQGLVDSNYDFMREGGLANEYRTSHLPGFIKGWQKGVPMTAGGPLKMAMRAYETVMEPTFQYYVPWLKNQAAVDRMKTFVEAHPNATREEFADYGRKVERQQTARMGEMNNDTNFLPATAKKMARAAMISYSFAAGQAENALGAAYDLSRIPDRIYRAIKGTKPSQEEIWSDRLSYAIAIPMTIAFTNSMYQYFLGAGEAPKSGQDLLNPRTGGTDPSTGEPERATLPSFANAYRHIWEGGAGQEAYNKLAPLWKTVIEAAENKDFKGQPIRNKNDTTMHQLEQLGDFVGKNMAPISVGQAGAAKGGSHINSLERWFGIRAAGMADTAPDKLKEIMSYKDAEAWYEKTRSEKNAERAKAGLGPMRISHRERSQLIQSIMKNPDSEPLKGYGGTQ